MTCIGCKWRALEMAPALGESQGWEPEQATSAAQVFANYIDLEGHDCADLDDSQPEAVKAH